MDQGSRQFDPTADLLDEDGRPVGEIGSRHYDPASTVLVRCPYPDARHGGPMNHTALRQLSACWDEVLAAAGHLAGSSATVHRAWRACIAGTRAPAVHAERHGLPIPRTLAAWYKASLGFSQVLTALLLADDGVADVPLADLGDADAFLALLERDRWLVGAAQVCAGPAPMIAQLYDALAHGTSGAAPPPVLGALGDPEGWVAPRVRWVAIQVATVLAARRAAARGETSASTADLDPGLPCLRGVLAVPGRRPEHARRLFESDAIPLALERHLAGLTS